LVAVHYNTGVALRDHRAVPGRFRHLIAPNAGRRRPVYPR
jgi:hypothetical protein